jgi:quercetin dioxygenase-like cupin family protein
MSTEGFAADGTMVTDLARLDLAKEMTDSEQKKPWPMGHFAKMLFKKSDFRMVLISMEKGSVMKEHHADGTISMQVLRGAIRISVQGAVHDLKAHNILTLGASIKHEVEALEDSAFLLTIAWPDSAKLEAMQHRGYGT